MRMERLKEENAAATTAAVAAAVTSPPVSFVGSAGASPPILPQVNKVRVCTSYSMYMALYPEFEIYMVCRNFPGMMFASIGARPLGPVRGD